MNEAEVKWVPDWDDYSLSFQSVMPSEMLNLNRTVAGYMHGNVIDYGCGAGKAIPFIVSQDRVTHYTGVDCSPEMVSRARWMASNYPDSSITVIDSRIEDTNIEPADCAMSVNSFYVWQDAQKVLAHIYRQLRAGGTFVLVTINPAIDMPGLLEAAEPEMIAHPHWAAFKKHNLSICGSDAINMCDLDTLIGRVRSVGFLVKEGHTHWYKNGLNFLLLSRA